MEHLNRLNRVPALVALALLLLAGCGRDEVVFQQRSEYQQVLVTEGREGVRTLRFGSRRGAVQSRVVVGDPLDLRVPYVRAAMAGLAFLEPPLDDFGTRSLSVLVVGLGGGSIPMYLHQVLPAAQIDVAELDPLVVQVADEWFGLREDERLRIRVGDGREWIEQAAARAAPRYDLIVLDAYGEREVPPALTTLEFLRAVRGVLAPGGVVVANLWGGRSNPLYPSMLRTYGEVFGQVHELAVPARSNRIVVALDSPTAAPRELERRAAHLARTLPGRLGLEELFRGDSRVDPEDLRGEVLRDG
ncbi:MAG: hypothetical protein DWQ36_15000 [Acidobacteria bacterium]|nr:MAG: hypothetical protein DWQ30_00100 [Acidobacteriota bacterium]REK06199.1 MAG: hypothetical protein DWQ36_15000 [Acidobacteriota bacterium]